MQNQPSGEPKWSKSSAYNYKVNYGHFSDITDKRRDKKNRWCRSKKESFCEERKMEKPQNSISKWKKNGAREVDLGINDDYMTLSANSDATGNWFTSTTKTTHTLSKLNARKKPFFFKSPPIFKEIPFEKKNSEPPLILAPATENQLSLKWILFAKSPNQCRAELHGWHEVCSLCRNQPDSWQASKKLKLGGIQETKRRRKWKDLEAPRMW